MAPFLIPIVEAVAPGLIKTVVDTGKELIDRIFPDKEKQAAERAAAEAHLLELVQTERMQERAQDIAVSLGQIEVNKVEAASDNLFKSGWRPAVGWVCVIALGFNYLAGPLLSWATGNLFGWTPLPTLEISQLVFILTGILGIGTLRTVEKLKNKE